MSPALRKALIVAIIHVLMVTSLGAKLLIDRATRPRVWARTAPVDPDLPIRGRYVRLRLEAHAASLPPTGHVVSVELSSQEGKLFALATTRRTGIHARTDIDRGTVLLLEPLAFFVPEHVPDPSNRPAGEELWVEVTIPRRGPPRPIRLGVMKDGVLTPLPAAQ